MRTKKRQQFTQMLKDSTEFRISDEARVAHLDAIFEAIKSAPVVLPQVPTRWSLSLRRRVTGLLVAAMTLGPAGVAFASQGSLPDDPLYSAKRLVEHIQAVFDPSVPARHRLDEVSALIARGADPSDVAQALIQAAEAVAAVPGSGELSALLESLRQEVETDLIEPAADDSEVNGKGSVEPGNKTETTDVTETAESPDEKTGSVGDTNVSDQTEPTDSTDTSGTESKDNETTVTEPAEQPEATGESIDSEAPEAESSTATEQPEQP